MWSMQDGPARIHIQRISVLIKDLAKRSLPPRKGIVIGEASVSTSSKMKARAHLDEKPMTHAKMPLQCLHNDNGGIVKRDTAISLFETTMMMKKIASVDLDGGTYNRRP